MNTPAPETRYAIYFVPGGDTALYRFGASVLGYDCHSGQDTALIAGADRASWPAIVRDARIYGFHATLKPPFRLTDGISEADLDAAFLNFAADRPAVFAGELAVRTIGAFIALVPREPQPPLDRLARACVRDFDRFRAAMTDKDRARRMVPGLSPRQIENIERWGYPYVLEDFRFHMTLTGALPPPERESTFRFLCEQFEQTEQAHLLTVDRIVIARQIGTSPFRVIRQALLGQSASRPYAYSV
jgi:hypothetical protein